MENREEYLEQIQTVIATLEAVQRQCRDTSVAGLISAAMYDAEYLHESMLLEWSRIATYAPEGFHAAAAVAPGGGNGPAIDLEEYCFPV